MYTRNLPLLGIPRLALTRCCSCLQPDTEAAIRARAMDLNAALALAVSAAPKSVWHQQDSAGRLPLHHLLENPLRQSLPGTIAFAELEMNLASADGRIAPAVVGARGSRGAAAYSAAHSAVDGHAATARGPSLSASGQAGFAAMGGGGGRRGGRTSASLGLGHSERGNGPRGI